MKIYKLFIDGGTTNTRFTLMYGDKAVSREEYGVGAASAVAAYKNHELENLVGRVIAEMQKTYCCQIDEIYASGMITSDVGICEVPHMKAPAGIDDLVKGINTKQINAAVEMKTLHFVPGVLFQDADGHVTDVMRGEEVEILGCLNERQIQGEVFFVHFGSHNKMVYCKDGKICNSVTTISGELLWLILNKTILKTSSSCDNETNMDETSIIRGYHNASLLGLSRALFMARLLQTKEHATEEQITSYIYGALMYEDLLAFSKLLNSQTAHTYILYGRQCFITAFTVCIKLFNKGFDGEIIKLAFEESEQLSVYGMNLISRQAESKVMN